MKLSEFKNKLNEFGFVDIIIKFNIPEYKKEITETYLFKKNRNGMIKSYMNAVEEFETPSIIHMYSIYRRVFIFKKRKINKSRAKSTKIWRHSNA